MKTKPVLKDYLLLLLVFLIPTQVAWHFWPEWSFVYGIRVDYLSPTIYLTDILIVLLLLASFKEVSSTLIRFVSSHKLFVFIASVVFIINVVSSLSPAVALIKWARILEAAFMVSYASSVRSDNLLNKIFKVLFLSAVFFSLIGIGQFVMRSTLGFSFLGERTFNTTTPGIALVTVFGREFLRTYSTFPHPNAMAGYLGIIVLLMPLFKKILVPKFFILGGFIIATAFVLTFSLAASLALIFSLLLLIFGLKNLKFLAAVLLLVSVFLSILLPAISEKLFYALNFLGPTVYERLDLAHVSGKMISDNLWTGVGLNNFIIAMTVYVGIESRIWLLQPVHNVFLLILAEVGLIGFAALVYVTKFIFKYTTVYFVVIFIFLLLTGLTDHYWLTLHQNIMFMAFIFGMSTRLEGRLMGS